MTKILLQYEDRKYFHPSPTSKMIKTITAILEKFGWEIDIAVEKLTRAEAKQLIEKGLRAAKRKGIRIFDTEEDIVNQELSLNSK